MERSCPLFDYQLGDAVSLSVRYSLRDSEWSLIGLLGAGLGHNPVVISTIRDKPIGPLEGIKEVAPFPLVRKLELSSGRSRGCWTRRTLRHAERTIESSGRFKLGSTHGMG